MPEEGALFVTLSEAQTAELLAKGTAHACVARADGYAQDVYVSLGTVGLSELQQMVESQVRKHRERLYGPQCVVCGRESVEPEAGEDTCPKCAKGTKVVWEV